MIFDRERRQRSCCKVWPGRRSGFDDELGGAHDGPAFDLGETTKLDIPRGRRGEGHVLERRIVFPSSAGDGLAPGLAVLRDADFEVPDAAVGRVLARDVEDSLDRTRGAEVDDQLVGISRSAADEFGVPDGVDVAVASLGRLIIGGEAVGRKSLVTRLGGGVRRFADPVEDRAIGGMLGVVPSRAADVGQAGRARGIGPPLPLRAPRLAKDQAGFGVAQIHDLERRVVIDDQRVFARGLRIGLGDAEDGVVGVASGAGVPVLPGLVKERIDLLPEGGEAQEPRAAEACIGIDRCVVDPRDGEDLPGASREVGVGLENLDPAAPEPARPGSAT